MSNANCRRCRREGIKLFLKGERCNSPKCSFTKRSYAPGIHGTSRLRRPTDYAIQLREKQKAKTIYQMRENQFKNSFTRAAKSKSNTAERLLQILETRLDNVIYRLGFASSRKEAKQLINHGKILVNGKKVTISSYSCKDKDIISLKEKQIKLSESIEIPVWLNLNKKKAEGQLLKVPSRNEIKTDISEQLIIEFYSR